MSREILFRGKEINNNFWVYGDLLTHEGFQHNEVDIRDYFQHRQCVVNSSTIGQFTGLIDKNGTKIFEGDIIEFDEQEWGSKYFEVVKWDYELLNMRKNDYKQWCEIVGNIWDNPELLKED